jgi:hypothetical protein
LDIHAEASWQVESCRPRYIVAAILQAHSAEATKRVSHRYFTASLGPCQLGCYDSAYAENRNAQRRRDKLSRKKRWQQLDEDTTYTATHLDNSVVNPNQIWLVIRAFKERLPEMFPDRFDENGEFEIPNRIISA